MHRIAHRAPAALIVATVMLAACTAREERGDTASAAPAASADTSPTVPETTRVDPAPGRPATVPRGEATPAPARTPTDAPPAPMSDTIRRRRPTPPTKPPGGYIYVDSTRPRPRPPR